MHIRQGPTKCVFSLGFKTTYLYNVEDQKYLLFLVLGLLLNLVIYIMQAHRVVSLSLLSFVSLFEADLRSLMEWKKCSVKFANLY